MKKTVYIFVFLIFIFNSCKDAGVYKGYMLQFNKTMNIIEKQNVEIYQFFATTGNNPHNPRYVRLKPYYDKTTDIQKNTSKTIAIIDNLLKVAISKSTTDTTNISYLQLSDNVLNKRVAILPLLKNINSEFEYLNPFFKSFLFDLEKDKKIVESIDNSVNYKEIKELLKDYRKIPLGEFISVALKIRLNIRLTEYYTLRYLANKVDYSVIRFYSLTPMVEPVSKIVPLSDYYKAKINLVVYNSTYDPTVEVENKPIQPKDGKAIYQERVASNTNKVKRKGNIMYISLHNGDSIKVPFKLEYEVIK